MEVDLQYRGPPESPWQLSFPPCTNPPQIWGSEPCNYPDAAQHTTSQHNGENNYPILPQLTIQAQLTQQRPQF